MPVTLTETAAAEIKRIMDAQEMEEGTAVRMGIGGGGGWCWAGRPWSSPPG